VGKFVFVLLGCSFAGTLNEMKKTFFYRNSFYYFYQEAAGTL